MRRRTFLASAGSAAALAVLGCTPGTTPGASAPATQPSPTPKPSTAPPLAWFTFAVNVHDWTHGQESAAALLRLIDVFSRHGVHGDFYLTPEITRVYAEQYPDVITRLRATGQGIGYHVRPPHPLSSGFEAPLRGLKGDALTAALREYETYAVDLRTGTLDRSRPGGYRYVAEVMGANPVTASPATADRTIAPAARAVFRELGAQATVTVHESGSSIEQPYRFAAGLLERPVDFSVTRTTPVDGRDTFWWNVIAGPGGEEYDPVAMLERQLGAWQAAGHPRPPYVISHIHENNLYRRGAEGWSSIYFTMENGQRGEPLAAPWNIDAPDPSRPRPAAESATIWEAYERLVAYAAERLQVVTMADIVAIARAEAGTSSSSPDGEASP